MKRVQSLCFTACGLILLCLSAIAESDRSVELMPAKSDIRLLVDVSGSMKQTDPANLRRPAVDLLVRLLPEDSRAAIWSFAEGVRPLVAHGQVDEPWRSAARSSAQFIGSNGLLTNIGAALDQAAFDAISPSPDYARHIILLTDGVVDISKDAAASQRERQRIVDQVLPRLKKAGLRVHTIALSDNSDIELMQMLARGTDGTSAIARNADELMQAFLNTFDAAAPAQQVPLTDAGFVVDASIQELTALIFRADATGQTSLVSPDGKTHSADSDSTGIRWHRAPNYDLITVTQPLQGQWQLLGDRAPGSRITVVSNLNLRVKTLPNNLVHGEALDVSFALEEAGQTLTEPSFLKLMDVRLSLASVSDNAASEVLNHQFDPGDLPADGVFQRTLSQFANLGVYAVSITVDGKTFQRSFNHRLAVHQPFLAELTEVTDENGQRSHLLRVLTHTDQIPVQSTRIIATVVGPDRRRLVRPLAHNAEAAEWTTKVPTSHPGAYQIQVRISGEDQLGDGFAFTLEPLQLTHAPAAAPEALPTAESEANPVPPLEAQAVELEPGEPAPSVVEEPAAPPGSNWLLYGALAFFNLLLIAGAFWLIRRQLKNAHPATGGDPEVGPAVVKDDDAFSMSTYGAEMEEEPPMEELDSAAEEPLPMPPAQPASVAAPPPRVEKTPPKEPEDDFGLDDLEDELMAQLADDSDSPQDADAQALELEDDEFSDAIASLIEDMEEPDSDDEPASPRDGDDDGVEQKQSASGQ